MNPDSEQTLNRFAAGEMNVAEENDFLACCEIEPARFRRAALAVVEHRRLTQALQAFAIPQDLADAKVHVTKQASSNRKHVNIVLMAATLSCVAIGGYFWNASNRNSTAVQSLAEPGIEVKQLPASSSTIAQSPAQQPAFADITASPMEAMHVEASRHPKTAIPPAKPSDIRVARPLTGLLADLFRVAQSEPIFNEQAKSKLRRDGWEVDEEPVIYVFSTDDGHQYAVPTHNANLRFVKQ